MGESLKINTTLAGVVQSRMQRQTMAMGHFEFAVEPQKVLDLLMVKYMEAVGQRAKVTIFDEPTQKSLLKVVEAITTPSSKFGLWLHGDKGSGKSTMARALLQLFESAYRLGYIKSSSQWFNGKGIFRPAKQIWEMKHTSPREFSNLKDAQILVIDDIGVDAKEYRDYGNVLTPITDLVFARYDLRAYTIVTSNIRPADIKSIYEDRFADRCREMFIPIRFSAPSYRPVDNALPNADNSINN